MSDALNTMQRAKKVYASLGRPTAMLQGLKPEDLTAFSSLCESDGTLVEGFKEKYDKIYLDYCEKNKASENISVEAEEETARDTSTGFNFGDAE